SYAAETSAARARTSSGRDRSAVSTARRAAGPPRRISAAACSPRSRSRAVRGAAGPRTASPAALPLPLPPGPPVTRQVVLFMRLLMKYDYHAPCPQRRMIARMADEGGRSEEGAPVPPPELRASTGYLLARLGAESRRRWARMLAEHGMTPHHYG